MNYFEAIVLGLVQGLTEFIPISSSGHLVVARELLNVSEAGLFYDVMLHMGTLLAVLIYFRKDIFDIFQKIQTDRTLLINIVIGTIPAVVAGVLFSGVVDMLGSHAIVAAGFMIVIGVVFLVVEYVYKKQDSASRKGVVEVTKKDALIIGLVQMCALLPGVSRSGMTIAAGLLRGLSRSEAARFSFLLSIPAIAGAGVYTALKTVSESAAIPLNGPILVGFFVSFASGLLAIDFLMRYLKKNGLSLFAWYLVLVGFGLCTFLFFQ